MNLLTRIATAVKYVVDPFAFREAYGATIDSDEEQWRRLGDIPDRDLMPLTQARMQKTALYLWDGNLLANRLIELPLAYLLAEGVSLRVPKAEQESQKVLDRFWADPINQMDIKLAKKVRELSLFGEQCWPTFVNEVDGHVRLGYVDPEEIATVVTDPDNREQPIGIVTRKNGKGAAKKYRVIVNGPDEELFTTRTCEIRRTDFPDGECFYFTINDLSLSRRGRSDLRAVSDWVDGYDQFLFGELERYNFLRSFIWDVTLTGADEPQVKKRAGEIKTPRPGSARVHNENEIWKTESPSLQANDTSEGARMFRNHVLGGATTPEHWFGGGGDVNRSTSDSMAEPTFKVYSMRQRTLKSMLECVGRYCIRQNIIAETGSEPDWNDERLKVEAVFPEMTTRDTTKWAAALQQVVAAVAMLIQQKLMTQEMALRLIASIAERLGVEIDPTTELEGAQKEASKKSEGDVFTGVAAQAKQTGNAQVMDVAAQAASAQAA